MERRGTGQERRGRNEQEDAARRGANYEFLVV